MVLAMKNYVLFLFSINIHYAQRLHVTGSKTTYYSGIGGNKVKTDILSNVKFKSSRVSLISIQLFTNSINTESQFHARLYIYTEDREMKDQFCPRRQRNEYNTVP